MIALRIVNAAACQLITPELALVICVHIWPLIFSLLRICKTPFIIALLHQLDGARR